MKIATIILMALNSLPLFQYLWVALPASRILRQNVTAEGVWVGFLVLGFAWGVILFPLMLIFNHWCSYRNLKNGRLMAAFRCQLVTSVYVALLAFYGLTIYAT